MVIFFISNIFPNQLRLVFEVFSDDFNRIIFWLHLNNWTVEKFLILYCLLVTFSICRIIFHIYKDWANKEVLLELDAGMLYNINTLLTFILLIYINVYPKEFSYEMVEYVIQILTPHICLPLLIFMISFIITQFSFVIKAPLRIEEFYPDSLWFSRIVKTCFIIAFLLLFKPQILFLTKALLFSLVLK